MDSKDSAKANETCSCKECHCSTNRPEAVVRDGKKYCCEGCATGSGCHHAGCECAE